MGSVCRLTHGDGAYLKRVKDLIIIESYFKSLAAAIPCGKVRARPAAGVTPRPMIPSRCAAESRTTYRALLLSWYLPHCEHLLMRKIPRRSVHLYLETGTRFQSQPLLGLSLIQPATLGILLPGTVSQHNGRRCVSLCSSLPISTTLSSL
jgi:hypothetical protein